MTDRPTPGPDEPDDVLVELASRYLDDDLSVDERAAAAADPVVMAWVARMGGVRESLQQPVTVTDEQRESAVAAALAELGRPTDVVRAPVVSDLAIARSRRNARLGKWLGAAAAIVALAIAGVAIAGNRDSGSDSSSAEVLAADTASTDAAADLNVAAEPTDTERQDKAAAPEAAATAPGAGQGGSAAETTVAPGDVARETGPADQAPATTAGAGSDTTLAVTGSAAPPVTAPNDADAPVSIDGPAALRTYATAATPVPDATAPCSSDVVEQLLSRNVTYDGDPAVVYRNDRDHVAVAYERVTCVVIVSVQLP